MKVIGGYKMFFNKDFARLVDLMPNAAKLAVEQGSFYANKKTELLYDGLYEILVHEMPIGVAKARTGDPEVYILEQVEAYLTAVESNQL
jgi:hypothetical protein